MKYRCTRNEPYQPGLAYFPPAYKDLSQRQGYYIEAESKEEAIAKMQSLFFEDRFGFTAEPT